MQKLKTSATFLTSRAIIPLNSLISPTQPFSTQEGMSAIVDAFKMASSPSSLIVSIN